MARLKLAIAVSTFILLAACYRGDPPKGIGSPATDFTLQDDSGSITLHRFRGKVVVLNFWASWCPPCIDETPSLVSMQQRLKGKGIVVVAVSSDEDEQAYRRFIKEYGINFETVRDPSERIQHLYGTVKIPETYIIDRNGILRRKFVSAVNWNSPEVLSYLSTM